jgi:2-C-methyl-D-erythritol 2,4-cyclodiphosphate synthase
MKYKGADSKLFLIEAIQLILENNFEIINIDATVLLEKPKLSIYKELIRSNIAGICGIDNKRVNIKAKTNEKLGFVGSSEGIAVYCIVELKIYS